MSKKNFIALADAIREHNTCSKRNQQYTPFTSDQIEMLAMYCKKQNAAFNRERFIGYVKGENGPNGGSIRSK